MSQSETLRLNCPKCTGSVRVPVNVVGKKVRCPRCKETFKVPGIAPAAAAEDDWLGFDQPVPTPAKPGATAPPGSASTTGSVTQSSAAAKPNRKAAAPPPAARPNAPAAANPATPQANAATDEFGFELPQGPQRSDAAVPPSPRQGGDFFGDDLPPPPSGDGSPGPAGFGPSDTAALERILGADALRQPDAGSDAAPVASQEVLEDKEVIQEFRVKCPVCASIRYARPDQVGQQIKCPDCYSKITVPKPPKRAKVYKPDIENAQVYSFTEASEPPPQFDSPHVRSAAELLREAEDAGVEEEDDDYENPDVKNWFISVFRIFLDPQVPVHAALLSVFGFLLMAGMAVASHPILLTPLVLINIFYWGFVAGCGFAIMEAVSNNDKRVEHWPYMDPIEWFGPLLTIGSVAALCIGPPMLVFSWAFGLSPLTLLGTMFCLFLGFPFVLISVLDSDSLFVPFSPSVTKSVERCKDQWGSLYFTSALLFTGLFFFYLVLYLMPASYAVGKILFLTPVTVVAIFAYFSMIGRLAYAIGHAVNAAPTPRNLARERRPPAEPPENA